MPKDTRFPTEEQRQQAIRWFNSLTGHFGQTYILLIAPGVELDRSRARVLNEGGQARIVHKDEFVEWLWFTYHQQIQAQEATPPQT